MWTWLPRDGVPMGIVVRKIVSGGQTGVDRGALDAAESLGLDRGGWCPSGRRAEDGAIPPQYPLVETPSPRYDVRTRYNVRDSDATLILHRGTLRGGTRLTRDYCRQRGKPYLVVPLGKARQHVARVRRWLAQQRVLVLNVAGPRESHEPGIARQTQQFLQRVLGPTARRRSRKLRSTP
jgi:hypothetical protein